MVRERGREEGQHLNSSSAGDSQGSRQGTVYWRQATRRQQHPASQHIHPQAKKKYKPSAWSPPPPGPGALNRVPRHARCRRRRRSRPHDASNSTNQPAAEASESKRQHQPQGPLRRRAGQEVCCCETLHRCVESVRPTTNFATSVVRRRSEAGWRTQAPGRSNASEVPDMPQVPKNVPRVAKYAPGPQKRLHKNTPSAYPA